MVKKITFPLITVLVFSLLFSNLAYAQDNPPPAQEGSLFQKLLRVRRAVGQITAIGENQLTLKKVDGSEQVILVNENTQYRDKNRQELSFGDLKTGQWVAALAPRSLLGEFTAKAIVLLPDDFDPSQIQGRRISGRVTAVDQAAGTITLDVPNRDEVAVDEETRYAGGVTSLEEVQVGMLATILGVEQEDNSLLAKVVGARNALHRNAGTVLSVDVETKSFVLKTRKGEEVTFIVDENTKYKSRQNQIQGLEDLQPEMVALILSKESASGDNLAVTIAAGDKDDLPKVDQRLPGKVVEVSESGFTLESRDGKQYIVQVNEETVFRSLGGKVRGLEDLEEGMLVMAGVQEGEGGEFLARLVIVGRRPGPKSPQPSTEPGTH